MNRQRQEGFSLIEVMVSVVIMSIGVLGVSALQTTSSVFTESGMYRSEAASLSREIVERMRVNLAEAKSGGYDFSTLPSKSTSCKGESSACATSDLRDHDIQDWGARMAALLPNSDAAIATTADNGVDPVVISITLQWDDSRGRKPLVSQVFAYELLGLAK